jgi:hypothetical protein
MQNFNRKNWGNDRLGTSLENVSVRVCAGFMWLMLRSSGGPFDLRKKEFLLQQSNHHIFSESSSLTDLLIHELVCCLEGSEPEVFVIVLSYLRVNSAILYATGNFYFCLYHPWLLQSRLAQGVKYLTCIRDMAGSNVYRDTDFSEAFVILFSLTRRMSVWSSKIVYGHLNYSPFSS